MFIGSTSHEDLLRDLAALWSVDLAQGWHLLTAQWRKAGCRCSPEDARPIPERARIAFYTSPPLPSEPLFLPDLSGDGEQGSTREP
jgi:hypothetical protein